MDLLRLSVLCMAAIMIAVLYTTTAMMGHASAFHPVVGAHQARSFGKTATLRMAAPGVAMATPDKIRAALQNPATTVVDARTIQEVQKDGYFHGCDDGKCHFVHAPSTKTESPLLQSAATSLIPDQQAPVVAYCASGIRAGTVKTVLEQLGYETVLNAGALSDLNSVR
jgi:rhodanese-related sulfurtransferase